MFRTNPDYLYLTYLEVYEKNKKQDENKPEKNTELFSFETQKETTTILLSSEGKFYPEYESDEFSTQDYIEHMLKEVKQTLIFLNGVWKIKNQNRIQDYIDTLASQKIDLKNVVYILRESRCKPVRQPGEVRAIPV